MLVVALLLVQTVAEIREPSDLIRREPRFDDANGSPRHHTSKVHPQGHVALEVDSKFSDAIVALADPNDTPDVLSGSSTGVGSTSASRQSLSFKKKAKNNVADDPLKRECGKGLYAPQGGCPESCPFTAELNASDKVCHFACISKLECGQPGFKREHSFPDPDTKVCRRCRVVGCEACAFGREDCIKCMEGYELQADGTCWSLGDLGFSAFTSIASVSVVVVIAYAFDLFFLRANTNPQGLTHGLQFRLRTVPKLVQPSTWYPLSTNLMTDQSVGGPGLCLHMRFQFYLIVWPLMLCFGYIALAFYFDEDLLVLGLKKTDPARESVDLCNLVRWGAQKSERLNIIKLVYTFSCYLFSFITLMLFGMSQEFQYRKMDMDNLTVKDFTAYLTGLPATRGHEFLEYSIQDLIEENTQCNTVGVSVCWDYSNQEDDVTIALEQYTERLEQSTDPVNWQKPMERPERAPPTWKAWEEGGPAIKTGKLFHKIDSLYREIMMGIPLTDPLDMEPKQVHDMLMDIKSTHAAYVVFNTESERNAAVEKFQTKVVSFEGKTLHLEECDTEPGAINWSNYTYPGSGPSRMTKVVKCGIYIVLLIGLWTFAFYVPFAYYLASQTEASGQPLSMMDFNFWILTGVVILGNQIMYLICDLAASWCAFELEDQKQACYTVLYSIAVFVCSMIDVVVTGFITYIIMLSKGVHTADGRELKEVTGLQEIVESYPMQRAFGQSLYAYAVPSTFILPFVLEGVFGIAAISVFASAIVKSRPEIRGRKAEKAMWYFLEMNMCRYGDLIFNVLLGTLVFFVAGGFTHWMFLLMAVGHIYIYLFDSWRIIRCTPSFCYSTQVIDVASQALMSLPCGIILGGTVFRFYEIYYPSEPFFSVLTVAIVLGLLHVSIHIYVVVYKLPNIAKGKTISSDGQYSQVAATRPENFFTSNPVHCLRSRYIYKHEIPCSYYMRGKDYLMLDNPDIGIHFCEYNDENEKAQKALLTNAVKQVCLNDGQAETPQKILPNADK